MIKRLSPDEYSNVISLVNNKSDPMICGCLEGEMGEIFVDDNISPKSAMIVIGDFSFFYGKAYEPLARNLPATVRNPGTYIGFPPDEWVLMLNEIYKDRLCRFDRYAFSHDKSRFDKEKLLFNINRISDKFAVVPFNKDIYNTVMSQEWSKDMCINFLSADDFVNRGMGFGAIIKDTGELVCGASSYAIYSGGIEIEIDTKREYRQKGLAAACASALILSCLEKGLYPSWDAANKISVKLAQKLGYKFSHTYDTYYIKED